MARRKDWRVETNSEIIPNARSSNAVCENNQARTLPLNLNQRKRLKNNLMKQLTMFSAEDEGAKKYSSKIEAPIYEPKNRPPHLMVICDDSKAVSLIREIDKSSLPDDEKAFLRLAAYRHCVFNYEQVADYYAHAGIEMQKLMEKSALVIIDFDSAIEGGFVRLCDEIKTQFMEEYDITTS